MSENSNPPPKNEKGFFVHVRVAVYENGVQVVEHSGKEQFRPPSPDGIFRYLSYTQAQTAFLVAYKAVMRLLLSKINGGKGL